MKYRILLVDDDNDILEVYQRALERNGFEVVVAKDGNEGLQKLKMSAFDLVVLDLVMPKMNGAEFLKIIRNDPALEDTRVLVSSGRVYDYKPKYPIGMFERLERFVDKITGARIKKEEMVIAGRTKISEKAEEIGNEGVTPDKIVIEEKRGLQEKMTAFGFVAPESEQKYRRRVSVELVERVRQMLGIKHVAGVVDEKPDASQLK